MWYDSAVDIFHTCSPVGGVARTERWFEETALLGQGMVHRRVISCNLVRLCLAKQ